jgi:large subunit ribosomal protein L30
MRHIEVEQIGSPIRREGSQRQTLVALGLNKIGRSKWVPDTPAMRGMIARVSHLVRITHDPAAPKPLVAPIYDEAADIALMRELAFDKNKIGLEPYDDAALKAGKTPDFKLLNDGIFCGYCEMKSPRDDFILKTPPPGGVAVRRNLPFYRKLGSHIKYAAEQFEAENSDHAYPNILVFVNHAPDIQRRDLIATIGRPERSRSCAIFAALRRRLILDPLKQQICTEPRPLFRVVPIDRAVKMVGRPPIRIENKVLVRPKIRFEPHHPF